MKILLLAPQPFYQDRGTPIAVRLLAETLADLGHRIDLLVYHEGKDLPPASGIRLVRAGRPPGIRGVRPGFSLKKVVCDVALFARARGLARREAYDVIHAVEEAVFMAMALGRSRGIPYVYDMDSSLADQMLETMPWLRPVAPWLRGCERHACRRALGVVAVCEALAEKARHAGARQVFVLPDAPLVPAAQERKSAAGLVPPLPWRGTRFLYVGNLEPYQGVDLLLRGWKEFLEAGGHGSLVIAGGPEKQAAAYRRQALAMGIGESAHVAGPVPLAALPELLEQADVLVSPRLKGINTPMKIYSYLQSGKPVLATRIAAHAQVLTPDIARLADPTPVGLAQGMAELARDEALRRRLGREGRERVMRDYGVESFRRRVREIYGWIEAHRGGPGGSSVPTS